MHASFGADWISAGSSADPSPPPFFSRVIPLKATLPVELPLATARMVRLDPLEDSTWDRGLSKFREANCFHSSGWLRVLHDTYGFVPSGLAMTRGSAVTALLTVMEVASPVTGRRGISLPFTDCCPVLGDSGEDGTPLLAAATGLAAERDWRYLELRGDDLVPAGTIASIRYLAHRLDLTSGERALWEGISPAARRAVKRAKAGGVTVSAEGDVAAIREFYRLHCLTRKRLGVPPQPLAFFENIRRHLVGRGLATVFLASHRGKTIAAAIHFHFQGNVMFKFGASEVTYQHLRANNLVMWEAIRRFAAAGAREMHLGRNEPGNLGLSRYKLGWGATESELEYHRFSPAGNAFVGGSNPQQAWHRRVFRHVPVPVARLIGGALYPHLA